ncbi:DNA polymerase III subunit theta [Serratia liquefaciens]|uniref:DNA polymerase III subunit theta n=1 Tax=Serratia liquefaciens TaxID=614 RepID=UPI0029160F0A|nr:DNA polymerase III subunit theta [Serratia liquefaciens]
MILLNSRILCHTISEINQKKNIDKANLDLTAPGLANKERINQPVIAIRWREQPRDLHEYFLERVAHWTT